MIRRLRPAPTTEQLAAMYPVPHDHRLYGRGHHERVEATIALAKTSIDEPFLPRSIGDLSCGNGEIARRLARPGDELYLGDLAMLPAELDAAGTYCGPIEETLSSIPWVDTFVCSETLEHLDDPLAVLGRIRAKASALVLSTPLECWEDTNNEHLWAWDREGVETSMRASGWTPEAFTSVDSREYGEPYLYGIWVAS